MSEQAHQGRIAGTQWNPDLYLKFSGQRLRPALELLDRVPVESPELIYDLGCGSGNVTRILARRWPSAALYGIDNSREMLKKAAAEASHIQWREADIRCWEPDEPCDLIYSNASLHWVEEHHRLFPRLVGFLRAGGFLAVQMPLSWGAPSHRIMRETLEDGAPGGKQIGTDRLRQAVALKWVEDAETYYDLLVGCTRSIDIWETEYLQVLEGDNPVLEWVRGTGLRPILNALDGVEREIFLVEYARRLRSAYPAKPDGRTLYPFRRLFIVAQRT
jgi:trans-aconitate 2-methyltransferase